MHHVYMEYNKLSDFVPFFPFPTPWTETHLNTQNGILILEWYFYSLVSIINMLIKTLLNCLYNRQFSSKTVAYIEACREKPAMADKEQTCLS